MPSIPVPFAHFCARERARALLPSRVSLIKAHPEWSRQYRLNAKRLLVGGRFDTGAPPPRIAYPILFNASLSIRERIDTVRGIVAGRAPAKSHRAFRAPVKLEETLLSLFPSNAQLASKYPPSCSKEPCNRAVSRIRNLKGDSVRRRVSSAHLPLAPVRRREFALRVRLHGSVSRSPAALHLPARKGEGILPARS